MSIRYGRASQWPCRLLRKRGVSQVDDLVSNRMLTIVWEADTSREHGVRATERKRLVANSLVEIARLEILCIHVFFQPEGFGDFHLELYVGGTNERQ